MRATYTYISSRRVEASLDSFLKAQRGRNSAVPNYAYASRLGSRRTRPSQAPRAMDLQAARLPQYHRVLSSTSASRSNFGGGVEQQGMTVLATSARERRRNSHGFL